jgi:CheY-like chemotaxis protein
MPIALICSPGPLDAELSETAVWRDELTRYVARTADDAVQKATDIRPQIVLIDRDMPGADRIVTAVRKDPQTRRSSIVVIARGDMDPVEVDLLEHGANAILRLPVSAEWDERLTRLIEVPTRHELRAPVRFEMEARTGDGVETQIAMVVNISVSGMLIDSPFPLHIGDDLDVSFRLPDSDAFIRGTGRVVRQAGRTQFGLEFYGLESDGRERIAAYIARGLGE